MKNRSNRNNPEYQGRESYLGHISHQLVLHNDEVHSFEFVIHALMEVCDHSAVQAEQCATLTHYRGKCGVKVGGRTEILRMKDQLADRGLEVSVELVKTK